MKFPLLAIAVLDKGFVFVGSIRFQDGFYTISNAQNIRRWGTKNGLGQLAESGPQSETVLDPSPEVFVPQHSLIYLMACKPDAWPQYA